MSSQQKQSEQQITMDSYQVYSSQTAVYGGRWQWQGLSYCILGLAGEAGEVANTAKKILRDDKGVITPERKEKLKGELGDVLWYVAQICTELDVNLHDVARMNLEKLRRRMDDDKICGDGSDR